VSFFANSTKAATNETSSAEGEGTVEVVDELEADVVIVVVGEIVVVVD
jgi:hypothetical protein